MARADVFRKALGMAPRQPTSSWSTTKTPSGTPTRRLDFYETVYSRAPLADNFSISLVRITKDFKIVPGTATHWAQTSPTTWEFYIMPGIMWSDGNELTANDLVETFRYSADPKHAWDFSWLLVGRDQELHRGGGRQGAPQLDRRQRGQGQVHLRRHHRGPGRLHPRSPCSTRCRLSAAGPGQVRQRAVQHQPGDRASPAGRTSSRRSTRRPRSC